MSTPIEIARSSSRRGVIVFGYTDPKWHFPVRILKEFGFQEVKKRRWNTDDASSVRKAETPKQMVSKYSYAPIKG